MFKLQKIYFIIGFLIILSGCSQKNNIQNVEKNKEPIVKKQYNCAKHIQIMQHASSYVIKEFDKGYFQQNDIIGAKAQLFLIENHSQSVFAQNINKAQTSYDLQYKLAKKHNCDLSKFRLSPIEIIKNKIKSLQQNSSDKVSGDKK